MSRRQAACQKDLSVDFTTAAALVSEMMEACDERCLVRFQKQMAAYQLLIIDDLGFAPHSKTGAELLFELNSQRYERGTTLITSNLSFDEWMQTLESERLPSALLVRITHHVSILEMNGDSYRLAQSRARKAAKTLSKIAAPAWDPRSGYALPEVSCAPHKWPTFTSPHGLVLPRR
ncbi:DNA replication protein DnaC [Rhizobium sp. SG_E_25_P2]|nr:DNA replication protein DnaC [Rhizobium sp. SG_E_25_P2]